MDAVIDQIIQENSIPLHAPPTISLALFAILSIVSLGMFALYWFSLSHNSTQLQLDEQGIDYLLQFTSGCQDIRYVCGSLALCIVWTMDFWGAFLYDYWRDGGLATSASSFGGDWGLRWCGWILGVVVWVVSMVVDLVLRVSWEWWLAIYLLWECIPIMQGEVSMDTPLWWERNFWRFWQRVWRSRTGRS